MLVNEPKQVCPICQVPVVPMTRYPDYVCEECACLAVDENVNSVSFSNEDIYGGLKGYVRDAVTGRAIYSRAITAKPEFMIRDINCYASEAHFGGIVIRPLR